MFSSALKSFTSNISSNYSISPNASSQSGPWKIYDGKKKGSGKAVSVFVFERKSLDPLGSSFGSRGGTTSLKRAHDEILERLKKEASALARLRHPSILELAEPLEDTRSGGLMFATELVTASLAGLLDEKTDQERLGGVGGRSSRYVIEDPDGKGRRRREIEIDELEIQKGLLQVAKGLEFLHESAGLVHANMTPEAIFINAKSDWKLSGLGFASPPDNSNGTSSLSPISLSEVLNYDARLPRSVQLNLDYASPDFVLDSNINTSADMFSLGLIIIALYNLPHRSPLDTNFSVSTYKRIFASSAAIPTQANDFLCSQSMPKDVTSSLLPRLVARRPAQRVSAREFQQDQYFDNILVSTMRFLDSLPAKSPNEKSQFLRGLPRILTQFPKGVLEKKVLVALLEETKDHELLSLILQNVFKIIELVVNGKRVFSERVLPTLRTVFLTSKKTKAPPQERESAKEGGVVVLLEKIAIVTANCSRKEFKDDILPILYQALESPTHSLVAASLQTLHVVLPVLDFSTIKNELFPVIAAVFSKTSSMAIKIKGLEALSALCGANLEEIGDPGDGLGGYNGQSKSINSSAALDKYTVQEKVVPLIKGIKTKEPAVMMAALGVLQQVSKIADTDFLAMDVLPTLFQFSLGPLLNLEQFQSFMTLIKSTSARIEREQTRKLQELSSTGGAGSRAVGSGTLGTMGTDVNGHVPIGGDETDFESLVSGRQAANTPSSNMFDGGWGTESTSRPLDSVARSQQLTNGGPSFAWSTPSSMATEPQSRSASLNAPATTFRTVTPDVMSQFASLAPAREGTGSITTFSQPSAPQRSAPNTVVFPRANSNSRVGAGPTDWSAANSGNAWSKNSMSLPLQPHIAAAQATTSYVAPKVMPQLQPSLHLNAYTDFRLAPPPSQGNSRINGSFTGDVPKINHAQKQGLDKYESLI